MTSSRLSGQLLAVLCLLSSLMAARGASWDNDFDQSFTFTCPMGQGINHMESYHDNHREDRRFHFSCVSLPGASSGVHCSWTHDYVNEFDKPAVYMCPADMYLAGVESYHENSREDRRFKYQCCRIQGIILKSCTGTGWLNDFDQRFNHTAPSRYVITGMASYHEDNTEDRRFQLFECAYA